MNNETIRRICKALNETPTLINDEVQQLKTKYPKLYNYVTTERYDDELLQLLLRKRLNIDSNVIETNMTVAEHIAEKYLYNENIKKPSEEEMEKHRERIRRFDYSKKT